MGLAGEIGYTSPMSKPCSIEFASRSDRGKVRRKNEDCLAINAPQGVAAIADGIGGNAHGEVASQMAVDACMEFLADAGGDTGKAQRDREMVLANAVKFANEAIIAVQQNNPDYSKMGCTLSCFTLQEQQLTYSWVGDSRIYRIRPHTNEVKQLSSDHTLDPDKIDRKTAPKLHRSAGRILTQRVGSILLLQPGTGTATVDEHDIILACTDGLSDKVDDERLLEYATRHADNLDDLAEQLLDRALDCGGQDNISLILARLSGGQ